MSPHPSFLPLRFGTLRERAAVGCGAEPGEGRAHAGATTGVSRGARAGVGRGDAPRHRRASGADPGAPGAHPQQAGREAAHAGQREPPLEGARRPPAPAHAHRQGRGADGAGAGRRVHDGQCRGR